MKIKITKTNANGNSFIIINSLKNNETFLKNKHKIIIDICRKYSTDGLIILKTKPDIIMDYYNNDGSWETLCVNGIICSSIFLNNQKSIETISMKCGDGIHEISKINNQYKVSMPNPKYKSKELQVAGKKGFYIDSGAKHFVIEQKKIWPDDLKLTETCKKIRYNKALFPDGINVNFFKIKNETTIEVKTYEKGIESLMQSCSSGSFACAYHYFKKNLNIKDITIINPGGNYLCSFNINNENNYIKSSGIIEYEKFYQIY
jgi:diaminopimelate epimerase|tara:strand:+ start:175 stop:954 length:780 start_codon:yes stop_codon:yes gene_type:complete